MKKYILLIAVFLTASCAQAAVTAANFPTLFSSQKVARNIDFGSKYGSKLDIYQPAEVKDSYPVIVFYYGGAWKTGSKDDYRFVAQEFTSRGYIVVIADYAKYPTVKFPEWQKDAAKSFAWVHNNIAAHKGDPWQTYVLGHSAGAHIGALLATDGNYLYEEQGHPSWIRAFAGLAGPYSFTPDEPDYQDMFGPPERYQYMQVDTFINGGQPPMLLLGGKDDKDVQFSNAEKVAAAIRQKGGEVELKQYDNTNHIDLIASLAVLSTASAPVANDVDAFFKRHQ